MSAPKLKRFYEHVGVVPVGNGYSIQLDGRPLRTPMQNSLTLNSQQLAEAVAEEWRVQDKEIVPETMPLTKLAFTAVDRVAPHKEAVVEQLAAYVNSDVVCYRATEPAELIKRQTQEWDPVFEWVGSEFGVSLRAGNGIEFVAQDHDTVNAITEVFANESEFFLAALHALTANSGSLLLSLAVAQGRFDPEEAFRMANCDALYQMEKWGADLEARSRLETLAAEFKNASNFLALVSGKDLKSNG